MCLQPPCRWDVAQVLRFWGGGQQEQQLPSKGSLCPAFWSLSHLRWVSVLYLIITLTQLIHFSASSLPLPVTLDSRIPITLLPPPDGILYVADSESSTIRAVSLTNGSVKDMVGGAIDPLVSKQPPWWCDCLHTFCQVVTISPDRT